MPPPVVRIPRLPLPLVTPRLVLRLPRPSDAPAIAAALSDREVTRTVPLWTHYTPGDAREFVRGARREARHQSGYLTVVERRDSGELIGTASLQIRPMRVHRRGHLGYWIAHPHWGRGYASEAASRLCQEAFGRLRLHKIETGVVIFNARSRAVLQRLGFRSEGRERENFRIDGRWVDAEIFGLLAREFRPYHPPSAAPPRAPAAASPRRRAPS